MKQLFVTSLILAYSCAQDEANAELTALANLAMQAWNEQNPDEQMTAEPAEAETTEAAEEEEEAEEEECKPECEFKLCLAEEVHVNRYDCWREECKGCGDPACAVWHYSPALESWIQDVCYKPFDYMAALKQGIAMVQKYELTAQLAFEQFCETNCDKDFSKDMGLLTSETLAPYLLDKETERANAFSYKAIQEFSTATNVDTSILQLGMAFGTTKDVKDGVDKAVKDSIGTEWFGQMLGSFFEGVFNYGLERKGEREDEVEAEAEAEVEPEPEPEPEPVYTWCYDDCDIDGETCNADCQTKKEAESGPRTDYAMVEDCSADCYNFDKTSNYHVCRASCQKRANKWCHAECVFDGKECDMECQTPIEDEEGPWEAYDDVLDCEPACYAYDATNDRHICDCFANDPSINKWCHGECVYSGGSLCDMACQVPIEGEEGPWTLYTNPEDCESDCYAYDSIADRHICQCEDLFGEGNKWCHGECVVENRSKCDLDCQLPIEEEEGPWDFYEEVSDCDADCYAFDEEAYRHICACDWW